jgi:hypothetical protein
LDGNHAHIHRLEEPMTADKMAYLAISHKAAHVLIDALEIVKDEHTDPGWSKNILTSIQNDLKEQLPAKKSKRKKQHAS